ncbi:hypothetical protein RRG08_048022 [Elysia crispata]|uniref:Uncharacterized protein n=1 Tax=Elysia crispata TaxID=231223 RepID=A0AAE1CLJ4_9GAST|nr:hypothetical protein RRG08_048022 [Elysia crispata]
MEVKHHQFRLTLTASPNFTVTFLTDVIERGKSNIPQCFVWGRTPQNQRGPALDADAQRLVPLSDRLLRSGRAH